MNRTINNLFVASIINLLTVLSLPSFAQMPDTWTKKDSISGVALYGAVSFSIGMNGYMGTGVPYTKNFWTYNSITGAWSQIADFGGYSRGLATGFSIGNKGYVGCGDDANQNGVFIHTSKDFWEYDPATNKWTRKADFGGVARRGAVGFGIGSKGYMGTGRDEGAPHFKDFWEYDPSNGVDGTWTQKADFAGDARAFAAVFVIGSKGYVGTGRTNTTFVKDFWEYDPSINVWTKKADFGGLIRYGAVGMNIGAYGYMGTGAASPGGLSNDFWEYNPVLDSWTQKTNFIGAKRYLAVSFSIGNKGYIGTGQIYDTYPNYVNSKDFGEYAPAAIWSGATSTNWESGTNWQSLSVPDGNTNVIIPANLVRYPIIGGTALCNNLTINSGTGVNLTIAAGRSLTVNGTLVNYAGTTGLFIKSDATGTGSLINSTPNVPATIERYLIGDWTSANSGWHFLSSPVASQAISDFATSNYDFYGWNEVSNLWMNYKAAGFSTWNGGGTNFNIGQGYMVSYQVNYTGTFPGNINVNNVTKSNLTRTGGGTNYTWHLLGNPFSSALKWNDGNWALNNVAGSAKIWNGGAKSYKDIAANDIIPMEQGFMVSVSSATNTITIPAASRIVNSTAWYKSSENNQIKLLASEEDGSSYQESNILVNPSASEGFDFDYDSRFLPGYAPQFYSESDNEKLSTNSLPSINETEVIPFGFIKNQSDYFKIELKKSVGGKPVFLYDLKTDSIQNLIDKPVYKFTSTEGDDPERFRLHFRDFTSAQREPFSLYQNSGYIYIATLQTVNAEIKISNMLGQVVLRAKTNGNLITSLNSATLQSGVYMVNYTGAGKVASKKIVISK